MQRFVDQNILVQSNQTIKQTKWKVCSSQKNRISLFLHICSNFVSQ